MANTNDLGIYPSIEAIDHDTRVYLGKVASQLVATGASYDAALASMRRVLESHIV